MLESEFSGNLVEVCPTGVFTDKTYKEHYTRKWDLQTAPSICTNCGLGCNTIPGERYGELRNIFGRYNGEVNGYFLCDRGRFGYEFVNSDHRIHQPLLRSDQGALEPASQETVGDHVTSFLSDAKVIGIGSPRASLEANFALRTLVGPDHFYNGMSANDSDLVATAIQILQTGPARTPSLHEVELADAVFVLGEDLTNTAPMLDLALRQSVRQQPIRRAVASRIAAWDDASVREFLQDEKGPLFIATPNSTKLDEISTQTYRAAPDDLARLGFAVAHALGADVPAVEGLSDDLRNLANNIAGALKEAERPLVISGTSCGSESVMQAAANVAWALCDDKRIAELCFTVPECNSVGVSLMGDRDISAAIQAVQNGEADTVLILENDLYRRADAASVEALLDAAKHVIVLDYLSTNATAQKAEVVLPAGTFAESDGTFVNNEGRAQRFYQVFVPKGDVQESWRWLQELMGAAGQLEERAWGNLDAITAALTEAIPLFKTIPEIAPPSGFRLVGQKIPRQSPRYSGRTSMLANINVSEPKPPEDPDSPFSFSMEGYAGVPPSSLISRFWSPGWNSPQAINKFQIEVGGALHGGDPGKRLIEPAENGKPSYFSDVPNPFEPRDGEWLIVPLYHIFGSDELSILTPGVAERAPQPYLALNPDDAAALQVGDGEEVEISLAGVPQRLPVKLSSALPKGVGGLPAGLPELHGIALTAWSQVTK